LGANLKQPPALGFGTMLNDRPDAEWSTVDGFKFWKSPFEVESEAP
jgi:hypothetical protein